MDSMAYSSNENNDNKEFETSFGFYDNNFFDTEATQAFNKKQESIFDQINSNSEMQFNDKPLGYQSTTNIFGLPPKPKITSSLNFSGNVTSCDKPYSSNPFKYENNDFFKPLNIMVINDKKMIKKFEKSQPEKFSYKNFMASTANINSHSSGFGTPISKYISSSTNFFSDIIINKTNDNNQ